jgi:hypothetical protein
MFNAAMKVNNDELTIRVNLKEDNGPSKSGKSIIIATSAGNKDIPGTDLKIGLNIYRPRFA